MMCDLSLCRFAHNFMRQFPFFQLWPDGVQHQLARVLLTEVRVRHETVISRGSPQHRLFFIITGRLRVTVPSGAAMADAGRASSPRSRAEEQEAPRTLAMLKKGDTCGEAALMGPCLAHADIVVDSPGATLLSLCLADFMRALKETLGLRHQDRLMHLRSHPLFVDVSLEDLDKASDLLKLGSYPPGTQLYPPRNKAAPTVYLISEGECCVRRRGRGAGGPRPEAPQDGEWVPPAYDADTASILGPLDVFGLDPPSVHAGGGWHVEAHTHVKAYHVTHELFRKLPGGMQKAIEGVCDFKAMYLKGRIKGLARLDVARKAPTYAAVK